MVLDRYARPAPHPRVNTLTNCLTKTENNDSFRFTYRPFEEFKGELIINKRTQRFVSEILIHKELCEELNTLGFEFHRGH